MQWSRGVVLLPSYRPPGPPTRNRASHVVSILQNESGFRDVEKGDKDHCRFHGEWTIHLIPVILLICILILYISSSDVPFEGHESLGNDMSNKIVEKSAITERHLQEASTLQAEEEHSFTELQNALGIKLEQQKLNLPSVPQMLLKGVVNSVH
ncbi:unnamed protein product [Sphagnum jensenii]|uniref:Uncharacterized protein n=1 Tax=Sphagnum jensenii TaxID=128206 RepID=A0ABP1BJA0_9BRYO